MTDLSVIILVGREELHIARCLEKLAPLEPRQVVVVESQTGDATHSLAEDTARKLGWEVQGCKLKVEGKNPPLGTRHSSLLAIFHAWPGNQAAQFNWAIDNVVGGRLKVEGGTADGDLPSWILRLDADEYLTPETIEKLKAELPTIPEDVSGLNLELKRRFCGGEICHATNGIRQVRLFRRGKARYAETLMDERIEVDGPVIDIPCAFYDDSLMPLEVWKEKHRSYAKREAVQALEGLKTGKWTDPRKATYYKLPPYLRAFLYFGVRYFLKGGFLDGYAGWMWNFWQGLWYRLLVDREIGKLRQSWDRTPVDAH